ncbi:MAG TPA: replication-associated recombination protein A [Chlamydiales bacterium]|nr:replication-associated recombination protein A [Chlamydiales bacterium]
MRNNLPLSEKIRPANFNDVVGHSSITDLLRKIIDSQKPLSLLFYGPPGSGKTTLARLYANSFPQRSIFLSAVSAGINDIKKILSDAKEMPLLHSQTILFLDEIHRFNKAQQDIFLPYLENGTLILIGATTENPSFSLNNALLSRLRIFTLSSLSNEDLSLILKRYEDLYQLQFPEDSKNLLLDLSKGDARHLLNLLENIETAKPDDLKLNTLAHILQRKAGLYDKKGDGHYNLISALHKSIRGSDPDASLYWLARMLSSGEDPLFIARRLIRAASEDIGLADPDALQVCLNAYQAYHTLGSPEGELAIAEAVLYLALAPKSNSVYVALGQAKEDAKDTDHLSPPAIILNAPTAFMKELGYGKGYIYDHETKDGFSGQNYFPDEMERVPYYQPKEIGFEREMQKRLAYFNKLRESFSA